MSNEIVTHQASAIAAREELSVEDMIAQVQKIQKVMNELMHEGEHYGVIPGTERKDKNGNDISKRSLYKPGAEKLCLMFRLDPQYDIKRERDGQHLDVLSTCTLYHIPSGQRVASGVGSCSTREAKYAYRKSGRACPECGEATIIKGKDEYGGGWLCFKSKGGCGQKWKDGDRIIEGQETGRVPNPDLADSHNTVVKMAAKRSLVAAVLNATAASDIFTQDMDDPEDDDEEKSARREVRAETKGKETEKKKSGAAVDPIADARSKTLHTLYAKKFGADVPREVRLKEAERVAGTIISSFNAVTKAQFEQMCSAWRELPDYDGTPQMPSRPAANGKPLDDAGVAKTLKTTVSPETDDDDLPFPTLSDQVKTLAIELGVWEQGKGVRIRDAAAQKLGIEPGIASLPDMVAINKLDALHALLTAAKAARAEKAEVAS